MTVAYNPFREMDRLFNEATRSLSRDSKLMPMDLYREGDQFIVKMDLPGVDPQRIDIDVDDRTLTVRAERSTSHEVKGENNQWVSRERSYGSYARQLTLGTGLDLGGIAAEYADGVLTLTVPVAEEAKPRKVLVTHGGHRQQIRSEATEVPTQA